MYFISPPSPNIFLMCGLYDQEFIGMGEKDGKLCIYRKSIFDLGNWKEFYFTDINVVKAECCKNGLHVATGLCNTKLWFAAREDKYTRIFSLNIYTLKFTRYEMLQEDNSSIVFHNVNLCCKCLSPILRFIGSDSDILSFDIIPQKYQKKVGILRILGDINKSNQCTMWKNTIKLDQRPVSSNILIDEKGKVLSIKKRTIKDGRIKRVSIKSEGGQRIIVISGKNDGYIDWLWHEMAFSSQNGLCLSRRQKGDKMFLQLFGVSLVSRPFTLQKLDYCTVDAKFPSLKSLHFYVSFRIVDKKYIPKRAIKALIGKTYSVPSYIYFQLADGSTVIIPLEVLSLSELSYIALSRISQSSQQPSLPLTVAMISNFYYYFQWIRSFCDPSKEHVLTNESKEDDVWMSQEFIRKKIGWPRILPLIKAPVLPTKSE